ncbi:hypothetical protein LTR27_007786 [Elasticomyces elasticus]|nr:hypothetical protein LTR27_007786 [Elasticomyces elasticus]
MSLINYATILSLIALPQSIIRRQDMTSSFAGFTDTDVLNYALTLEHLESAFYAQGLTQFQDADFIAAGLLVADRHRLIEIAAHEKEQVDYLTTALGSAATAACNYTFPPVSVGFFLLNAMQLEGVGVSAYLGAAQLIASKDTLTAAATILKIEARHSAYLRDLGSGSQLSPFPTAQDTPLSPNEVYTLASGFITSCPASNPKLPVKAFASLSSPPFATAGQTLEFIVGNAVLAKGSNTAKLSAAFITAGGPIFAHLTEAGDGVSFSVEIPTLGVLGQSYLVLTNCAERADDQTIVAGPAIVEVSRPAA